MPWGARARLKSCLRAAHATQFRGLKQMTRRSHNSGKQSVDPILAAARLETTIDSTDLFNRKFKASKRSSIHRIAR